VQRTRCDRGHPPITATELARTTNKAEPSAAENGGSGVSPDCGSAIRPCAKEAKRSDYAERSGKRVPLNIKSSQRAAKSRTALRDLPFARQKDALFALIFHRIRALLCVCT
jgi:hypothetical protein